MRLALLPILALICASCSSTKPPVAMTSPAADRGGPVITRIVERRQVIVVRAGPRGPTYSLESNHGETVVPPMTLDQLALNRPDLFQTVRTMQATQWAGMNLP